MYQTYINEAIRPDSSANQMWEKTIQNLVHCQFNEKSVDALEKLIKSIYSVGNIEYSMIQPELLIAQLVGATHGINKLAQTKHIKHFTQFINTLISITTKFLPSQDTSTTLTPQEADLQFINTFFNQTIFIITHNLLLEVTQADIESPIQKEAKELEALIAASKIGLEPHQSSTPLTSGLLAITRSFTQIFINSSATHPCNPILSQIAHCLSTNEALQKIQTGFTTSFAEQIDELQCVAGSFNCMKTQFQAICYTPNKPLTFLLDTDYFDRIQETVLLITQNTTTQQEQYAQLDLLFCGFTTANPTDPYLTKALYAIYNNVSEIDTWITAISSTSSPKESGQATALIKSYLVSRFLGNEYTSMVGEIRIKENTPFINSIMKNNDFNIAFAYCLGLLAIKKDQKEKLYQEFIKGLTKKNNFQNAWFKFMLSEHITYEVYQQARFMYSSWIPYLTSLPPADILTPIFSQYAELLEAIHTKDMSNTANALQKRLIIYIDYLGHFIASANSIQDGFTLLQTCKPKHVEHLLRCITFSAEIKPIFDALVSSEKKKAVKTAPATTLTSIPFFSKDLINDLTSRIQKLGTTPASLPLDDLSMELTQRKVNTLLCLYILVSNAHSLGEQKAWVKFCFSLIEQILSKAKGQLLETVLMQTITTANVHSLLAKSHQKEFSALLQQAQSDWCPDEKTLASLAAEKKTSKGKKTKKAKESSTESPIDTAADITSDTPKQTINTPTDTALLASLPILPVIANQSDTTIEFLDEHASHSSEDLHHQASLSELEVLPAQPQPTSKKPLELFTKNIKKCVGTLQTVVSTLQGIDSLPTGWIHAIDDTQRALNPLFRLITSADTPLQPQPESTTASYAELDKKSQIGLENSWNSALTACCWTLYRETAKYRETIEPTDRLDTTVQEALTTLSFCYFKNMRLHYSKAHLSIIEKISSHLAQYGYRVYLRGSYVYPEDNLDLDFGIFSDSPSSATTFNSRLHELILREIQQVTTEQIYQNAEIWSLKATWAIEGQIIPVDIVCYLSNFSKEAMIALTKKSLLSIPSPLWDCQQSRACMTEQAARANHGEKISLVPLVQITEDADWIPFMGYVVKHLIKIGDKATYAPKIQELISGYLDPKTRHQARPGATQASIDLNTKIGFSILSYLLSRFPSRTQKNIDFILKYQLLRLIFPIDPKTYKTCENYYNQYFKPTNPISDGTLSSEAFLTMFFLGAILDQPSENLARTLQAIEKAILACEQNSPLPKLFVNIQKLLSTCPPTSGYFYSHFISQSPPIPTISTEQVNHKIQVLAAWHPVVVARQAQDTTPSEDSQASTSVTTAKKLKKKTKAPGFFSPEPNHEGAAADPVEMPPPYSPREEPAPNTFNP